MNLPRITLLLYLLATFFIGCTDHEPEPDQPNQPEEPQVERPVVVTGNMAVLNSDQFRFAVSLLNVAPNSIKQYGVVYSLHEYDVLKSYTDKPNVDWTRIVFTGNPDNGAHTKDIVAPATTFFRFYYRGYAILNDDSVVYGEIKYYQQDQTGRAILEYVGKPKLVKPYHSGVVLLDLGQKPIKNFGVVYSYKTSANQAISALPTLADKSVKFSYAQIKIEVGGAGTGFRLDNLDLDSVDEMYVRSFVEYTDGTVDYGRYVGHEMK